MAEQRLDLLSLRKQLGIPPHAVAARLGVMSDWYRQLAKNPKHYRRVLLATLEAAIEAQRSLELLESAFPHETIYAYSTTDF